MAADVHKGKRMPALNRFGSDGLKRDILASSEADSSIRDA